MGRFNASVSALMTAVCAGLAVAPGAAQAQQDDQFRRDRNQSVSDRPKPEYDAPGIPAGAFRFYPELGIVGYYDDNIFATAADEEEDFVTELQARAALKSNWSSNALNFRGSVDSSFYSDFSDENATDWTVGTDGRIDVVRGFYVAGGVSYSALHEARSDSQITSNLAEPIEYSSASANVDVVKAMNRIKFTGRGRYTVFDYEDGSLVGGGTLDEDDRDRTIAELGGRIDYAISPDTALFFSVAGNWRDYDQDPPEVPLNRDSDGVEGLVGASFDLTHLVRGEVSIGYMKQSYDDPDLESVSGVTTRTRVEWFIDPLLTLTFTAARDVQDAGVSNAGGYITDGVGLNVDYELRRNVVLGLGLGYSRDDYNGIDREDERTRIQATAQYLLNRNASLAFEVGRFEQDSSGADFGREYEIDRALIALRLRR